MYKRNSLKNLSKHVTFRKLCFDLFEEDVLILNMLKFKMLLLSGLLSTK